MRIIGHLNGESTARTFSDFLYVQGIENQIEADKDNSWAVWIHSEEEMTRAKDWLTRFQNNPNDSSFRTAARAANDLRENKKKEQAVYEKRVKERRQLFRPMTAYGFGLVTFALIVLCVVSYASGFFNGAASLYGLYISRQDIAGGFGERLQHFKILLPEIRRGQIWRLVTPIFLHFSPLHIFFNMLWLKDLGSMIEARQNSLLLIIMVVAIAAVSNLAQFLVAGPLFGGMSGVVYGLVGYIWIRGKLDPASGLYLHPNTVMMMLVWYLVCLFGVMGVANTCHTVGLLMGMAWGGLASLRHR